ncbi:hypothetical protein F66182_3840 [Fusarium sp. NRRL 66182]|nr:hypothetical protein F66182_3840 [Fusarium sp. NRRL 66182]
MSKNKDTVHADARRFLDERGSNVSVAPNGLNPATIMEKAVKDRIVDSYFYKEQCFALNEADIVDRVVEHINFVGGTYGVTQKPSPFLCLAFKLLELSPSDAILLEYLQYGGEAFKYLRALACFYFRLTRQAKDVYEMLEPFLEDRRKLRRRGRAGVMLTYMDEFVDELLTKDRVCGTSLWKMPKREVLEDLEILEPRMKERERMEQGKSLERSQTEMRWTLIVTRGGGAQVEVGVGVGVGVAAGARATVVHPDQTGNIRPKVSEGQVIRQNETRPVPTLHREALAASRGPQAWNDVTRPNHRYSRQANDHIIRICEDAFGT